MAEKTTRPREATWAGLAIIIGSVVIVVSAFERIASLNTLDARREIQDMLAEPPGSGLGLSVDAMLEIIRATSMVAGGLAAATAILGYQVLQRSRAGRRTLAVLAPPLFLSGLVAGGFMASVVAASTVWLYLQPSRDWFNGKEPKRREPVGSTKSIWSGARPTDESRQTPNPGAPTSDTAPRGQDPAPPPSSQGTEQESPTPRAVVGFGDASATSTSTTATLDSSSAHSHPPSAPPRPGVVTAGCLITWIFCALSILMLTLTALFITIAPDDLFDALEERDPDFAGGQSRDTIADASVITCVVLIIWAAAAIVAAVLAYRHNKIGWLALTISSGAGSVLLGIGALFSVTLLFPFAAAAATFSLMLRPAAVAWFRSDAAR